MKWHPGIRIDKIPVTATAAGLIFAIGIIFIALIGVPATQGLLMIALPGGVLFSIIQYWCHSRT